MAEPAINPHSCSHETTHSMPSSFPSGPASRRCCLTCFRCVWQLPNEHLLVLCFGSSSLHILIAVRTDRKLPHIPSGVMPFSMHQPKSAIYVTSCGLFVAMVARGTSCVISLTYITTCDSFQKTLGPTLACSSLSATRPGSMSALTALHVAPKAPSDATTGVPWPCWHPMEVPQLLYCRYTSGLRL